MPSGVGMKKVSVLSFGSIVVRISFSVCVHKGHKRFLLGSQYTSGITRVCISMSLRSLPVCEPLASWLMVDLEEPGSDNGRLPQKAALASGGRRFLVRFPAVRDERTA